MTEAFYQSKGVATVPHRAASGPSFSDEDLLDDDLDDADWNTALALADGSRASAPSVAGPPRVCADAGSQFQDEDLEDADRDAPLVAAAATLPTPSRSAPPARKRGHVRALTPDDDPEPGEDVDDEDADRKRAKATSLMTVSTGARRSVAAASLFRRLPFPPYPHLNACCHSC